MVVAQQNHCARKTIFGKAEICLPYVEGYHECYTDSKVKLLADGTEVPINMVLGFYLNHQTFIKKDSLGLLPFDDYFKIYGTKELKDQKAGFDELKQVQSMLEGNFISKNWDLIKKEVDKVGLDVEIGVPVVIKSYNLDKNSFTILMLNKNEIEKGKFVTTAMTLNGLLINERLVWMAYYLNYKDQNTMVLLEKNSNLILNKILNAQK